MTLYSIWILVVSASFWVVKVDNLSYLFGSLFDAGRWPIDVFRGVFRGALRFAFTFIFPLALMTTYPGAGAAGKAGAEHGAVRAGGRRGVRDGVAAGVEEGTGDVYVGELVDLLSPASAWGAVGSGVATSDARLAEPHRSSTVEPPISNWRFGLGSGNVVRAGN